MAVRATSAKHTPPVCEITQAMDSSRTIEAVLFSTLKINRMINFVYLICCIDHVTTLFHELHAAIENAFLITRVNTLIYFQVYYQVIYRR